MSLLLVLVLLLSAALSLEAADRFSASPHDLTNKKILMVSIAFRGHAIPLMNLGAELADRGYDIVFASHAEAQPWFDEILAERRGSMHPSNGTATFVSLGKFPYPETTLRSNLAFACEEQTHIWGMLHLLNTIYMPLVRPMQNALLTLFDNMAANDEMPRLAVVDAGSVGALHATKARKLRTIINAPSLLVDINLGTEAGSYGASIPAFGTGFSTRMSILDRVANLLFTRFLSVVFMPFFSYYNGLAEELGIPALQGQNDFFAAYPTIVNTAYGIAFPIRTPPTVHPVGPLLPPAAMNRSALRSPLLLDAWLSQDEARVAYVNLGSMTTMAQARIEAIVAGLTHPSMRVLWMLPSHYRAALPADIPPSFRAKTLGGLDHYKVLAHDAVKVVVSHCGMAAAQEALYFGKPVVCLPLFADQNDVSMRIAEFGAGEIIPSTDVTPDTLSASALSIIDRHEYAARAQMLGERIRRAGSSHRAASVVEQIAELGDDAARMAHVQLPWHRENHLDVLLVLLAFVFTGAALVRIVAVCVTRSVVKWLARVAPEVLAPVQPSTPERADRELDGAEGAPSPSSEMGSRSSRELSQGPE